MMADLRHGDCLEVLAGLPDNSVDSCVTDPPYGLRFMGKAWDCSVPGVDVWREVLRVLKPGGHLLCFAGTRTQHRMAVAIEDAGFEIRDLIAWVYGSGFPKSHDTLKPAMEPITVARKPLVGTVAENVQEWGTGGINVDGCRVGSEDLSAQWDRSWNQDGSFGNGKRASRGQQVPAGRWPANLIHDGREEVLAGFPESKTPGTYETGHRDTTAYSGGWRPREVRVGHAVDGSAARFFYCAKASRADRNEGLDGLPVRRSVDDDWKSTNRAETPSCGVPSKQANHHPTVKPTDLMRYLCRLVTPPGGLVLDPFMGSGSTGKAAVLEGFRFLGIEREAEYCEIARARIEAASGDQLPLAVSVGGRR